MGEVHMSTLANEATFADKWDMFSTPVPTFNFEG
jgi:hypothetical protein